MNFAKKTTSYDHLIASQKNTTFFIKCAPILGIILGIVAAIALSFSTVGLALLAIFVVGGFVTKWILTHKFQTNTQEIIKLFNEAYGVSEPMQTKYVKDNFRLNEILKTHNLLAYNNNGSLNFVSADFCAINEINSLNSHYINCLNSDFGMFSIPITSIDNFRRDATTTILTLFSENVRRIEFNSDTVFEYFIPNKEYYFSTSKK